MRPPLLALTIFAILLESITAFPSYGFLKTRYVSTGPEESISPLGLKTISSESSIVHSTNTQQKDLQWKESSHDITQKDIDYITKNPTKNIENQSDLYLCETDTHASSNHDCSHNNSYQDDSAEMKSKNETIIIRFLYSLLETFQGLTRTLRDWNSTKTADMTPVGSAEQPKCSSWSGCTTTPEYAQTFPKNGLKRRQSTDKINNGKVQESFPLPTPQDPPIAKAVAPKSFPLPTPQNPPKAKAINPGSVPLPLPPLNLGVGTKKSRFHRLPAPPDAASIIRNGQRTKQQSTAQTISTVNDRKKIGHPLPPPPEAAANFDRKAFSVPPTQIGGSDFRSVSRFTIPASQ